jgi:hypothetical protein
LKVHPVKGKVLLEDGKPLTTGSVVLMSPDKGIEFEGPIQSDGSFSVKSSSGEGAPEGNYKVRIEPDASKLTGTKSRGKKNLGNLPFPGKYADESTSGLAVSVKPGDNELEPFKLTK